MGITRIRTRGAPACLLLLGGAAPLCAGDLTLHLEGSGAWSRAVVQYACDAHGGELGLPAGPFKVEYLNGHGNSLAIVPVAGESLIFAGVWSASGARYAARGLVWWDAAGRTAIFESETPAGRAPATCRRIRAQ
jgi:membrane-bound inhibitor of C-type lysozyme